MAQASIPVDVFNPGQVFACMGFLEVANVLAGGAQGGFSWTSESDVSFELSTNDAEDPVRLVLDFLLEAELMRLAPKGYSDPPPTDSKKKGERKSAKGGDDSAEVEPLEQGPPCVVEVFPGRKADRATLPLRLERNGLLLEVTHWCDGSSRIPFKLFAGQQRSDVIADRMIGAIREMARPSKEGVLRNPMGHTMPLGGSSFKFDARKSWTAIDAGYSPDEQKHGVEASPIVELLAAMGLEHTRPDEIGVRRVRYGVWKGLLPPVLARPALGGIGFGIEMRRFTFTFALAGKNKVVTFAEEEITA